MFSDDDYIYKYTEKDAVEDGILVDLLAIRKEWKDCMFNYATIGLINLGYVKEDKVSIPNLIDLINQAGIIVKKANKEDWFYSGIIELPNGEKQKMFIAQNSTGRFTLMLPEEY